MGAERGMALAVQRPMPTRSSEGRATRLVVIEGGAALRPRRAGRPTQPSAVAVERAPPKLLDRLR